MDPKITSALIAAAVSLVGLLVGFFYLRIKARHEREKVVAEVRKELSLDSHRTRRVFGATLEQLRIELYKLQSAITDNGIPIREKKERVRAALAAVIEAYGSYEEKWASSKATLSLAGVSVGSTLHHELRNYLNLCRTSAESFIRSDENTSNEGGVEIPVEKARGAADTFIQFLAELEKKEIGSFIFTLGNHSERA